MEVALTGARYNGPQSIGDCDNDGKNEINEGIVIIDSGQQYTEWVFKYGWET